MPRLHTTRPAVELRTVATVPKCEIEATPGGDSRIGMAGKYENGAPLIEVRVIHPIAGSGDDSGSHETMGLS